MKSTKPTVKDCEVCELMEQAGVFTKQEVQDYHDSNIGMEAFSKDKQEILMEIFAELDN